MNRGETHCASHSNFKAAVVERTTLECIQVWIVSARAAILLHLEEHQATDFICARFFLKNREKMIRAGLGIFELCVVFLLSLSAHRPVSSRLATGRSWRNAASSSELSSRSAALPSSARFAQRPEQAIDRLFCADPRFPSHHASHVGLYFRDLAEVKRLLGV